MIWFWGHYLSNINDVSSQSKAVSCCATENGVEHCMFNRIKQPIGEISAKKHGGLSTVRWCYFDRSFTAVDTPLTKGTMALQHQPQPLLRCSHTMLR